MFRPELCGYCGRADLVIIRTIRKRFRDLTEARRSAVSLMYVIRVGQCPGCGIRTIPHTDAISGTSLGPRTRATLQACERAHNTEDDTVMMAGDPLRRRTIRHKEFLGLPGRITP